MEKWLEIDWAGVFLPKTSLLEIVVRSALIYLALTILLRIIPKRQLGKSSVGDILFIVLIAEIAGPGIVGEARSLPDFILCLLMVFFWSFALDWLAFRSPWFRRLTQESPTCLIRDGRILPENLRWEMMTEEELKAQLRLQNVNDLSQVKEAQLEADGEISVVKECDRGALEKSSTSPSEENGVGEGEASHPSKREEPGAAPRSNGQWRHEAPSGERETEKAANQSPVEDGEVELQDFLAAAGRLQEKIAWHQQQAADHQAQVAAFRQALARHGVRTKSGATRRNSETTHQ